ncbi:unnamed protein product, partial [Vitis vinifera]
MVFPSSPLHRAQLPISYSRERVCEREISEMAIDFHLCDDADEDYIDMEVSSYSNFLCHSISSPPHPREFEFHMSSSSLEREITTSPADELFYKGKLLPLHLPPRLQMQSSFGLKLKASRAYLKSLFGKPGCSDESCVAPARTVDEASGSKSKESLKKINEDGGHHRRSFSGAFKRHLITKSSSSLSSSGSSSSSSSSNANGSHEFQFLKRSSSANSEFECSIQGAIAHCKQSQQLFRSRKTVSEVGFCTLSASRIAVCDDQERPVLCRG